MNTMTSTQDLAGFLPHQGHMVWIDYVVEANETGGTCLVIVDKNKYYFGEEQVRQSSFIEWMAQGFGFSNALKVKQGLAQGSVTNAFLVGFNNVKFGDTLPQEAEELLITTNATRSIGPITYIEGKVQSKVSGVIYCEAQLKLFSN
ncbi:hypothetical protein SHI21_13280 [Bacteriovorax sp. PP10]|uniref:Uncharacterized protein n=1 Tax=Bacteriovorax antarcticus TaxID=3088717 RepID=A0ABU5VVV3_9BACT|nr:hypothetical protein [Bacteriovorax sp. PP10]MEA9357191.1 hypothetical protein [Bacteriovorax sp. PP10]